VKPRRNTCQESADCQNRATLIAGDKRSGFLAASIRIFIAHFLEASSRLVADLIKDSEETVGGKDEQR
jgi:hypothetical protein